MKMELDLCKYNKGITYIYALDLFKIKKYKENVINKRRKIKFEIFNRNGLSVKNLNSIYSYQVTNFEKLSARSVCNIKTL